MLFFLIKVVSLLRHPFSIAIASPSREKSGVLSDSFGPKRSTMLRDFLDKCDVHVMWDLVLKKKKMCFDVWKVLGMYQLSLCFHFQLKRFLSLLFFSIPCCIFFFILNVFLLERHVPRLISVQKWDGGACYKKKLLLFLNVCIYTSTAARVAMGASLSMSSKCEVLYTSCPCDSERLFLSLSLPGLRRSTPFRNGLDPRRRGSVEHRCFYFFHFGAKSFQIARNIFKISRWERVEKVRQVIM